MYCDGANMNALLGITRPGDQGFDMIHLNLHKTFSTPHGGGGPGAGVLGVKSFLSEYLPVPQVVKRDSGGYSLDYTTKKSVGRVRSFYGNFGMHVRAYSYIHSWGNKIRKVSEHAILNANYLQALLKDTFDLSYDRRCAHEFVLSSNRFGEKSALKIAKRLMDYGFHPPTIYFPLIVPEALMIEPTETEPKERLDAFCEALLAIAREAAEDKDVVKEAPHHRPVRRLDEVKAAERAIVKDRFDEHPDLGGEPRSEEHTSELQSRQYLVCRLLLEKKKKKSVNNTDSTYKANTHRP